MTRKARAARAGTPRPGAQTPRGPRRARRLIAPLAAAVLLTIAAAVVAIVWIVRSDETVERTFDAQIEALPLGEPSSVIVSGVLQGEPLGRVAVIIQRLLPIPPQRGGIPVPIDGVMLVFSPDGFLSLNMSGTLQLTPEGAEIVDARGTATNGAGDFEGVKGSFTLTGGRANPRSVSGRFEVFGTLEY